MNLQPNQFYIPGQVPSSKNGRRCLCNKRAKKKDGTTGESGILLGSPQLEVYLSETRMHWFDTGRKFREYVAKHNIPYPLVLRFTFIRTDRSSFDWAGPLETVQDCMTGGKFKSCMKNVPLKVNLWAWVKDDSTAYITPDLLGSKIEISKTGKAGAGVIIEIVH